MKSAMTFGEWLRRRRMALGMTHAALADGAHCSVSALRKIEGDERRPSHRLAERLVDCLRVPDAQRAALVDGRARRAQHGAARQGPDGLAVAAPAGGGGQRHADRTAGLRRRDAFDRRAALRQPQRRRGERTLRRRTGRGTVERAGEDPRACGWPRARRPSRSRAPGTSTCRPSRDA